MKLDNVKEKDKGHKSGLETAVYRAMKGILKHKKGKGTPRIQYESEKITYVLIKEYNPDFILTFPGGRKVYIEAKGYFRPADRTKMLAVKRQNPGIDLRIIFGRNNKLGKKMTYTDWCDRHDFKWAVGEVPAAWLR